MFKLNFDALSLFSRGRKNEYQALVETIETLCATILLLRCMDIGISEDIYSQLADDSKKYFKLEP